MAEPASVTDALDSLIPFDPSNPQPITPQPDHATIEGLEIDNAAKMTPPPSTQANTTRPKDRTPTPSYSSISTPPPTLDLSTAQQSKLSTAIAATLSAEQIAESSAEELRCAIAELQSAYQEAKMNAAHYKLQYQMLAQESEAAMERMDVEARMAQHENDIIHIAEQSRAASTPVQSVGQDGMIPVQKDLYQYMCVEIQQLHKTTDALQRENNRQDKLILQQETEIESLSERVALLRDRIRSNREHLNYLRKPTIVADADLPRPVFATPNRASLTGQDQFAALLQASELARKEANPSRKSSQSKSTSAYRHVTMTPQRYQKPQTIFATPGQSKSYATPATAPLPRSTTTHSQVSYAHPSSRSAATTATMHRPAAPRSEDTVSNSDRDVDSEAETDIIENDGPVSESQASVTASLMLRTSHEDDFDSRLAAARSAKARTQPKQTTLFGAVRKHGIDRSDPERPSKRQRSDAVGLGITGARH